MSVITTSLALTACGERDHQTPLRKTLGAGGPGGVRGRQACLRLDELTKRLAANSSGFILHTRDYELVDKAADIGKFAVLDTSTRKVRDSRARVGAGAPFMKTGTSLGELTSAPPADALLGVAKQDACARVTFKSGYEFKVREGDARSITLENVETRETRVYTASDRDLRIKVITEGHVRDCEGGAAKARTEAVTVRLAWGEAVGAVRLTDTYAKLIGAGTSEPEPATRRTSPRRAGAPAAPDVTLAAFMFERLVQDAAAGAPKCAP